jgi:hypothetical protein
MPENHFPEDLFPQEHIPEEPDLQVSAAESEPVQTRGIGWIIVPALLGVLVGALIGLAQALGPAPKGVVADARTRLLEGGLGGAVIGLMIGCGFGLLVWVVFPYKGRNPHAPQQQEEKKEERAPEGTEEHGKQREGVGGDGEQKY